MATGYCRLIFNFFPHWIRQKVCWHKIRPHTKPLARITDRRTVSEDAHTVRSEDGEITHAGQSQHCAGTCVGENALSGWSGVGEVKGTRQSGTSITSW